MKKMKKLLSMLLTVIMVLAMAAPSFADTQKGSITINQAIENQEYSIYKIFDLESYEGGNYSYKVVDAWREFIAEDYSEYFTINAEGYLTENKLTDSDESFDRAAFAKAALEYASQKPITPVREAITADSTGIVTFSGIDLGYYLVDSSAGALCILDTAKPDMTVNEKNEAPTIDKERAYGEGEDSTDASVSVGDIVNYTITIVAKAGAQEYKIHDAMTGLRFKELTSVVKNDDPVAIEQYVLSQGGELEDGCAFELSFTSEFYGTLSKDDTIVVSYSAIVTEDAIEKDKATNTAKLEYGSKGITDTTPTDVVESPTYDFGLMKTRTDGTLLDGATFTLHKKNADDSYTQIFVVYDEANGYYRKANEGETPENITAGKVVIAGLGNGTYGLREEEAPTGFNKLEGFSDITINGADKLVMTPEDNAYAEGDGGIQIINNVGTMLPSTGGIGTTIFYAAGIILMAGAVFFVVRRKKA